MLELEFPCEYPIKAMGRAGDGFETLVFGLISPHVPGLQPGDLHANPSRQGNYVAVSVTITAGSRAQLEAIYRDLGGSPRVLTVL